MKHLTTEIAGFGASGPQFVNCPDADQRSTGRGRQWPEIIRAACQDFLTALSGEDHDARVDDVRSRAWTPRRGRPQPVRWQSVPPVRTPRPVPHTAPLSIRSALAAACFSQNDRLTPLRAVACAAACAAFSSSATEFLRTGMRSTVFLPAHFGPYRVCPLALQAIGIDNSAPAICSPRRARTRARNSSGRSPRSRAPGSEDRIVFSRRALLELRFSPDSLRHATERRVQPGPFRLMVSRSSVSGAAGGGRCGRRTRRAPRARPGRATIGRVCCS